MTDAIKSGLYCLVRITYIAPFLVDGPEYVASIADSSLKQKTCTLPDQVSIGMIED